MKVSLRKLSIGSVKGWGWACGLALALWSGGHARAEQLLLARTLSGGQFQYVVSRGDSLASIGSRYGVDTSVLAEQNGRKGRPRLKPGTVLWVDTRHIVPADIDDGILINVPQRMLFLLSGGNPSLAFPVAAGKSDWRTPRGEFSVAEMRKNPVWRVPESIQAEMEDEGKVVRTRVPPGPNNPLGKYFIGLSLSGIGIHGTIQPLSIHHFRTHGCIRLHPDDVAALFDAVSVATPGKIIYAPVLMAQLDDGRIFVEANPDIYNLESDPIGQLEALADSRNLRKMVDWRQVRETVERRDGLAREVTVGRECWWNVLPMEMWGLSPLASGLDRSAAGACSSWER